MALVDKLNDLRARWERLSDRERVMVGGLGVAFVVTLLVGTAWSIASGLSDLEEENLAMRQALKDIDQHRDAYQRAKAKTAQLEVRMGRGGIQLQGFLESSAKEAGVEIAETNERPPQPVGKKYVERTVDLRLRKVQLDDLAMFLRKVETGPNLVVVSSLNVRSRDDKHLDLEVEMSVSTYEHAPEPKPGKKDSKDAKEPKGA